MLKFFRNQKNAWLMKGILILTALSFVSLFGISNFIETIPDEGKTVASVQGEKITVAEYVNEVDKKVSAFGKLLQKPLTRKDIVEMGMLVPVFNEMVSKLVMQASVKDMKLEVSEQAVRQAIQSMPEFTGYDGSFSMQAYKQALNDLGKTEKEFVEEMFLTLKMAQITSGAEVATVAPVEIAKLQYQVENEKRTLDLFTITSFLLKVAGAPTQEEKEEIYDELSDDLIAPEYRTFSVMHLTLKDAASKIKVSEDELKELYEETKDIYSKEEIRDIDQMLFNTEEEAQKAYNALKNGKGFLTVAKEFASQTEEQTKLGDMTMSTATGDWSEPVFAAKKGEVVGPVETAFGWQILRVNAITPKVEKSFKEVRNDIEKRYIDSLSFDTLNETMITLEDKFGAGESLEDVASSAGLKITTYKMVDPSGIDNKEKKLGLSKDILSVAFMGGEEEISPMTEEEDGYFVVRVDEIVDPRLKSMEESEKEIMTAWREEAQSKKAKEIAENIQKDLNKGVAPRTIANKYKVSYTRLPNVTKTDEKLPAVIAYGVFSKPIKEVVTASNQTGILVARTTAITPANPEKNKIEVTNIKHALQEEIAKEKSDAFLADYGQMLGLEVKENLFSKALSYLSNSAQSEGE